MAIHNNTCLHISKHGVAFWMPELTSPSHHSKQIRRHLGSKQIVPQLPCTLLSDHDMRPAPTVPVWFGNTPLGRRIHCYQFLWLLTNQVSGFKVIIENNTLPPPASKCWGLSGAQNARWGYFSYCASDLGLIQAAVYRSRQPDQHHSPRKAAAHLHSGRSRLTWG